MKTKNQYEIGDHLIRDFAEVYKKTEYYCSDFEGKTILICGGAGFLGSLFVKYFLYLNKFRLWESCKIISIDNFLGRSHTEQPHDKNLTNLQHDLTTDLSLKLHNKKIDFIINCSGCASPYFYEKYPLETMEVSTIGTKNMLQLALNHNARILNFSSSEVVGTPPPEFIPTDEEYTPTVKTFDKRSCYDVTKMYIETLSYVFKDQFNLDCKVVRPFNVIGYFRQDDQRVIPNFMSKCINNDKIRVYAPGNQTRSFCWYGDFISGCLKVLTKGKDILYHIGSPENEISMIDLAKLVEKVCGKKDIVELVDPPIVYKHEPKRRCPSVDKIKKELDYTLDVPLEEALKRIFDWVKKNYK